MACECLGIFDSLVRTMPSSGGLAHYLFPRSKLPWIKGFASARVPEPVTCRAPDPEEGRWTTYWVQRTRWRRRIYSRSFLFHIRNPRSVHPVSDFQRILEPESRASYHGSVHFNCLIGRHLSYWEFGTRVSRVGFPAASRVQDAGSPLWITRRCRMYQYIFRCFWDVFYALCVLHKIVLVTYLYTTKIGDTGYAAINAGPWSFHFDTA